MKIHPAEMVCKIINEQDGFVGPVMTNLINNEISKCTWITFSVNLDRSCNEVWQI